MVIGGEAVVTCTARATSWAWPAPGRCRRPVGRLKGLASVASVHARLRVHVILRFVKQLRRMAMAAADMGAATPYSG